MKIVCGTHGHCFDGLASATVFTAWMRKRKPEARVSVVGFGYGPNQTKPSQTSLAGDENAILDFRYAPLEKLDFYFDHHRTAFQTPDDEEHFKSRRARTPENFVFDAGAKSCTKLLYDTLVARADLEKTRELDALVEWADIVDSARFVSAAQATDHASPLLQLVHVVEQFGDDELLGKLVPRILDDGLEATAKSPIVQKKFASIAPKLSLYRNLVVAEGRSEKGVLFLDLSAKKLDAPAKFVQYAEFPEATYSVILARLVSGLKISVGHNPWSGRPCEKDIGELCAKFGGGGHFMVGGISFPKDQLASALAAANYIKEALHAP